MIKYPNLCIASAHFPYYFAAIASNPWTPSSGKSSRDNLIPQSKNPPPYLICFSVITIDFSAAQQKSGGYMRNIISHSPERALVLIAGGANTRRTGSRRTGFSGTTADAESRKDLFQFNTAAVRTFIFPFMGCNAHQQFGLFPTLCTAISIYRHTQSPRFDLFRPIRIS